MPLNTRTPGDAPAVPARRPASVLTGSGTAARKPLTSASETRNTTTFFFIARFVIAYDHSTQDRDEVDVGVGADDRRCHCGGARLAARSAGSTGTTAFIA